MLRVWSLIIRTLEELDGAEARLVLLDLPPMDVDRVSLLLSHHKRTDRGHDQRLDTILPDEGFSSAMINLFYLC